MKTSKSTIGALHPILFFIGIYVVALFFSIFICSTVFYSLNGDPGNAPAEMSHKTSTQGNTYQASVAVMH